MTRNCDQCGAEYVALRPGSRYCGDTCRKRAARARSTDTLGDGGGVDPGPVVVAVRAELEATGRAETPLGAAALALAGRVDASTSGAAMAAAVRELRAVLAELEAGAPRAPSTVDELRRRRALRVRAAGDPS